MSKKSLKSNSIIIAVALLIIAVVCFAIYMLSSSNIFDTSGGYIKDMAKDGDVATFVEEAETPSYEAIVSNKNSLEEFKGKPLKYWGCIDSKEVFNDKTALYKMTVILNKEDTNKLGDKYKKNSEGLALAQITFRTSAGYNNFVVGDYVFMYGNLTELNDSDGELIPHFEAVKVVLDSEV